MCHAHDVRFLQRKEEYEFTECMGCGFIFIPSITREELEAKQQEGPPSVERGAPEDGWAPDVQFLEPAFERLEGEQHDILDFGCGQSSIPDLLRKQGHRVLGVDLEPPLRPHPDRLTGDIFEMDLEDNQFDLVYSYQVFEHLPEPRPFLQELLRLTSPGGYLLIHTDMDTPQREEGFSNWFYVLPPDHCSYYRSRTFEKVLCEEPGHLVWSNPWSALIKAAPQEAN